jgi:hypothetical protein
MTVRSRFPERAFAIQLLLQPTQGLFHGFTLL